MKQYYYLVEFLSSGGLSADDTSTLFFSNFTEDNPDDIIKNEIIKFDKYGQSWRTKTIQSKPLPSSLFAHRFVHRKTDLDKKISGILKELKRGEKERSALAEAF